MAGSPGLGYQRPHEPQRGGGDGGGTAVVRFTVSRSGQVLSAGLASSSGISVIDGAALAAVRGSLPAAPPGVSVSSLAVTVPMRFRPGG